MSDNINDPFANSKYNNDENSLSIKIILLSAIAYVIAMAWSDYVQFITNKFYPVTDSTSIGKRFIIVVCITIALFLLAYLLVYLMKVSHQVKRTFEPTKREDEM